jgi:hypothetical protein
LIKQEQDIYNIVFHEIIRQVNKKKIGFDFQIFIISYELNMKVTVECKERGEVLSKLRERYAAILSRVPREVKW